MDVSLMCVDFEDIICASEGALFWPASFQLVQPDDADPSFEILTEDGEEKTITKNKMEETIIQVIEGSVGINSAIANDIKKAIIEDDMGYIDATASDALIQLAAFGEIVYG